MVGTPLAKAFLSALVALLLAPTLAGASPSQLSIFQDDATFVRPTPRDQEAAFAEAKALGADIVRVFVSWHSVSPNQDSRTRPEGFDVADPDSPGYQWGLYDNVVDRARRHGLKLMFTLSPPMPWWASEEPSRCPHRIGGYSHLTLSCMWKPPPRLFGQFVRAVVLRYGSNAVPHGGQVALWSLWNEPNLEHYLYPQFKRTRQGIVDLAAARYRQLWLAGYKEIARYDPATRGKVLFGETAAISSPMDTLYAALCLDEAGRPFRGRMRAAHGCANPRRLPIGGLALHPYNNFAIGSVFTRSFTKDSLPMAYLGRAHKLLDRAARYGRIPGGRGIYITEFGFQSSPPDPFGDSLPLGRHAAAINESERLFWGDGRIKSTAQYELFDVPESEDFNTGLYLTDGEAKPALAAYRMPLVVTKLSPNAVEIWGGVRPADGRVRPEVTIASGSLSGRVVGRPLTNRTGYYRFVYRRPGAAKLRFRATWSESIGGATSLPSGDEAEELRSRVAVAGRPIRYRE
jgi:hypothetical protein